MADELKLIAIEQVKIGMFIKLDLSWLEHSFATSSFKITNPQQILDLQALNLKTIRYCPSKSDLALIQSAQPPVLTALPPASTQIKVYGSVLEAKRASLERLKQQREEIERCEAKFVDAATVVKNIGKTIFHSPAATLLEANKLVDSIADAFVNKNDTIMHLMQITAGDEENYFHALNVSVLSMMIASAMKCTKEQPVAAWGDKLGCDQADGVAVLLKLSRPVMCTTKASMPIRHGGRLAINGISCSRGTLGLTSSGLPALFTP